MHPALAVYHPATVYGHAVPQSAAAVIAIAFFVALMIIVARGIASLSRG